MISAPGSPGQHYPDDDPSLGKPPGRGGSRPPPPPRPPAPLPPGGGLPPPSSPTLPTYQTAAWQGRESPSLPAAGQMGGSGAAGGSADTTDRPAIMPIGFLQDRIPPGIVQPINRGELDTTQGIKQQLTQHSPQDIFKALSAARRWSTGQAAGNAARVLAAVQPLGGYQNPGLLSEGQRRDIARMEARTYQPGQQDFFPAPPPDPRPYWNGVRNPVLDPQARNPRAQALQAGNFPPPRPPINYTSSPESQLLTTPGVAMPPPGAQPGRLPPGPVAAPAIPTFNTKEEWLRWLMRNDEAV